MAEEETPKVEEDMLKNLHISNCILRIKPQARVLPNPKPPPQHSVELGRSELLLQKTAHWTQRE